MNTGMLSARYAKALFAYATELGVEDAVYDSMKALVRSRLEMKNLLILLRDPALKPQERVEHICSMLDASPVIRRFVQLVVEEEREGLLIFIAHSYIALYREKKEVYAVRFITATPLDDSAKRAIENILESKENKRVEVEYAVDGSIIGGFMMETLSRRVDASVEGQLRRIRKDIIKQNRKLV